MPKAKSTTRTLSRRQMVALLGSGVVMLRSGSTEAEALPPNACRDVAPQTGTIAFDGATSPVLGGDPCCTEGLDAFFNGYNNMKGPEKAHLRVFAEALQAERGALREYCVMIWGINQAESDRIANDIKERYRMIPYKPKPAPTPKKK